MKKIILCFSLLMFVSCASSVVYHPFTGPYRQTTEVDVYMTEKPIKPYKEIGRIEVTEGAGGGKDMVSVAIKKAKEVGADGVILLTDKKDTGYIVSGNLILPGTVKHLVFIAIKYIEKSDLSVFE